MPNKSIQKSILKELEIDQLPEDKQQEILTGMTEIVLKRIIFRVLSSFSEAQKDEFNIICAGGDTEKVNEYLVVNVPDCEEVIKDEIDKFKKETKEMVDALLA